MKQYNTLKAEVESWSAFSRRVQDAVELAQLDDESLRPELEAEMRRASEALEFEKAAQLRDRIKALKQQQIC